VTTFQQPVSTSLGEVDTTPPTDTEQVRTPAEAGAHPALPGLRTQSRQTEPTNEWTGPTAGGAHPETVSATAYGAHLSTPAHQEIETVDSDQLIDARQTDKLGMPKLSRPEFGAGMVAAVAAVAAGVFGFVNSFTAVKNWASKAGFEYPALVPLMVDMLIPSLGVINCLLIVKNAQPRWLRWMPLAMTGATVYLNVNAGTNLSYKIAHGFSAAIFALVSEVAMYLFRKRAGIENGTAMGRVRPSRWLLSPVRTFKLWRRMMLWEITSYAHALELEKSRLLLVADLEERFGSKWRKEAPARLLVGLRMGQVPDLDAPAEAVEAAPERTAIEAPAAPVDTEVRDQLAELSTVVRALAEQVPTPAPAAAVEAVTLPAQSVGFERPTPSWGTPSAHPSAHQVPAEVGTWAPRADTYVDTSRTESSTEVRTQAEPVDLERQQAGQRWLSESLAKARETTEARTPEAWVPTVFDAVADDVRTEEADANEAGQEDRDLNPVERLVIIRKARSEGLSQRKAAQLALCSPTYVRKVWDADDAAAEEAESA
jgi:hypothetical protein